MSGVKSYQFDALKRGTDENTPRQCKKCEKVMPLSMFSVNGRGYYEHECKACKRDRSNAGYQKEKAVGSDKYWEKRLSAIKQGAALRELSCDITIEDLKSLYAKQRGLCYYTGEQMQVCSVDRIDSERGYQADNIVMCERYINVFRGDMSISNFLKLCHKIVQNHPDRLATLMQEQTRKKVLEDLTDAVRKIVQVEGVKLHREEKLWLRAIFDNLIGVIKEERK
jgi:hypothetical protein